MLITATIFATACSQQPAESRQAAGPNLPIKFTLKCAAPAGSEIPYGAEKGFEILIDRLANRFSLSWDKQPWPIKRIDANQIILVDDHEDQGPDNNPYDRKITFDPRSGSLHFREVYSTIVPYDRNFSSHCEIANNA